AMNSVMLVRHGHVIAESWWEPYGPETRHVLYSLSKSFTSTAVGFAVAEGRLTIDDEVLSFFPEDAPSQPTNNLKAMRIRDLLTMSAGHQDETSPAADKISPKAFLAHPVPHKPGTHFRYNTLPRSCCRPSCKRKPDRRYSTICSRNSSNHWASQEPPGTQTGREFRWAATG